MASRMLLAESVFFGLPVVLAHGHTLVSAVVESLLGALGGGAFGAIVLTPLLVLAWAFVLTPLVVLAGGVALTPLDVLAATGVLAGAATFAFRGHDFNYTAKTNDKYLCYILCVFSIRARSHVEDM